MTTIYTTVAIERHQCGECGVWFGLDTEFRDRRQKDGQTFYCPNGHKRVYRETELQRVQRRAEQAENSLAWARKDSDRARAAALSAQRSAAATRGHLTRKQKQLERVKNGVCPCCNRSFANLSRHIASQHPDFEPLAPRA